MQPFLLVGQYWWDLTCWPVRTVNWSKWAAPVLPHVRKERNKHLTGYSVLDHSGPTPKHKLLTFLKKYIVFIEVILLVA